MTLLGIQSLSKSFGSQVLFKELSFTISEGDRIGLIGPNGSGKSTLLKILVGLEKEDFGSITKRRGLKVGYASQSPEFLPLSLEDILVENLQGDEIELLTRARILLGKAGFSDFSQNANALSGGWKKRLDIARALMQEPDLLLLDEPTNHLDLEGILWLEKFLARERISYVVISHDRYFLENISSKVIEINRAYPQGIFISEGDMSTFMERKESFLEGQKERERSLNSTVKEEIAWLRTSPKARTTKSRSRIQKAYELMQEHEGVKIRNKVAKVEIEFSQSERQTRKLISAKNLAKSRGGKLLFEGLDLILSPGSRLGVVGRNGTGKTTLLKMLAGEVSQDVGTIKYADDLKIVYFDQHRQKIDENVTLKEALSPLGDMVNYRGTFIHVNGWAKKFLFSPERLTLPVKCLSGGERARILLSRLMLEPADVLFLDEPTNDLDIPTLELIEEGLLEFEGAVVLISHDRCLMDRVCTNIIGLGEGIEEYFFADYSQWEQAILQKKEEKIEEKISAPQANKKETAPKKLSYKEQKELEAMETQILHEEEKISRLQEELSSSSIQSNPHKSLECYKLLAERECRRDALFVRWQELLNKSSC